MCLAPAQLLTHGFPWGGATLVPKRYIRPRIKEHQQLMTCLSSCLPSIPLPLASACYFGYERFLEWNKSFLFWEWKCSEVWDCDFNQSFGGWDSIRDHHCWWREQKYQSSCSYCSTGNLNHQCNLLNPFVSNAKLSSFCMYPTFHTWFTLSILEHWIISRLI